LTPVVRVREAIRGVHQHQGRVDGLVNNTGRSYAAAIEEIDPSLFDEIFHLNVLGPIVAMQAVITAMWAHGGESIVNINSGTAFMAIPQYSVYSSSKRALLGFSLTVRAELEKDRMVVSEIYPFITSRPSQNSLRICRAWRAAYLPVPLRFVPRTLRALRAREPNPPAPSSNRLILRGKFREKAVGVFVDFDLAAHHAARVA
jgi:NAD(P)-dependent dehydrogenase (short-subunit alcohol dehydrogenase family)